MVAAMSEGTVIATGLASIWILVASSDQWDTRLASQTRRTIPTAIR
jgi:hypothetical protein